MTILIHDDLTVRIRSHMNGDNLSLCNKVIKSFLCLHSATLGSISPCVSDHKHTYLNKWSNIRFY